MRYLLFLTSLISSSLYSCPSVFDKWPQECEIYDRYNAVKESFHKEFSIDVEYLNGYRSIRLIPRYLIDEVDKDIVKNPWEYYAPSQSWKFWERGQYFMEKISDQILTDDKNIQIKHLKLIHKKLMDKKLKLMGFSRFIPGVKSGQLRGWFDPPTGTQFTSDNPLNEDQVNYLSDYDIRDYKGRSAIRFLPAVYKVHGGQSASLFYLKGHRVEKTLKFHFRKFNVIWNALKKGDNSQEVSPVALAATLQKTLISIHPFHEANGRLTRLFEDIVLRQFGLPYAPAGDLMDDLLDPIPTYTDKTRQALMNVVEELEFCLRDYRKSKLTQVAVAPICRNLYFKNEFESNEIVEQRRTMRINILKLLPKDQDHRLGRLLHEVPTVQLKNNWHHKLQRAWNSHITFKRKSKSSS